MTTASRPTQPTLFTAADLPLFSNTPARAHDEVFTPQPAAPKQSAFVSFREENNCAPQPGIDFDPDAPMCQDDYEYLTGTGSYSPAPSQSEQAARANEDPAEIAECLIDEMIKHASDEPRAKEMINTLANAITTNKMQSAIAAAEELLAELTNQ